VASDVAAALAVLAGITLFLFGAGLDLTVIGLPAGITADILGILLILFGLGIFSKKQVRGG
jgi:hypothetical protein